VKAAKKAAVAKKPKAVAKKTAVKEKGGEQA
jgi:hypothetical protein